MQESSKKFENTLKMIKVTARAAMISLLPYMVTTEAAKARVTVDTSKPESFLDQARDQAVPSMSPEGAHDSQQETLQTFQEKLLDLLEKLESGEYTPDDVFDTARDLEQLLKTLNQTPFNQELQKALEALRLDRSVSDTETLIDLENPITNMNERERNAIKDFLEKLQEILNPDIPQS